MQGNGRPPQIPTVSHGYVLYSVCPLCAIQRDTQMMFTLGDHRRNLEKFLVLAIAKSLSDLAITVFLCSWHLFQCN